MFGHDYYVAFCKAFNKYCIYNEPLKNIVCNQTFAIGITSLRCALKEFFAVTSDVKIKYLYIWSEFRQEVQSVDNSIKVFLRWIVNNSACCEELDANTKTVHYYEANYLWKVGQRDYLFRPMACDAVDEYIGSTPRRNVQLEKIFKKINSFCEFICNPKVPMVFNNQRLEHAVKFFLECYLLKYINLSKCGPIPDQTIIDGYKNISFDWYFTYHDMLFSFSSSYEPSFKYQFIDWFEARVIFLNSLPSSNFKNAVAL